MKKTMKKLVALALSLMIVCGVAAGPGFEGIALVLNAGAADAATGFTPVAKEEANIAEDEDGNKLCGEGWALYKDGELVISGNIALADGAAPWSEFASQVKQVSIIGDAVTEIEDGTFAGVTIGSIYIPASVESLSKEAFNVNANGVISGLADIYYGGTSESWAGLETGIENVSIHYHAKHSEPDEAINAYQKPCKEGYSGDKYCEVCGALIAAGKVTDAEHNLDTETGKVLVDDPKYYEGHDGKHGYAFKCADCGEFVIGEDNAIEWKDSGDSGDPDHIFDVTGHSGKCGEEGSKFSEKCILCKKEFLNETSPAEHQFGEEQTQEPTCTEKGKTYRVCKICGEEESEPIPALGHIEKTNIKEPTCESVGFEQIVCTREGCGEVLSERTIPMHTVFSDDSPFRYIGENRKTEYKNVEPPTCKKEGLNQLFCAEPVLDENGEPLMKPVVDENGDQVYDEFGDPVMEAVVCGAPIVDENGDFITEVVPVDPDAHILEDKGTPATCVEDGEKINVCTECGEQIGLVEKLPATGHDWELTDSKSCLEGGGTATFTCKNCQETKTVEVAATDSHTLEAVHVDPTCTEKGYYYQKCTVEGCGYESERTEEKAALGHDYQPLKRDATCEENGVECKKCTRCGDIIEKKVIDKLDHKNYELEITTEVTCEHAGEAVWYCPDCKLTVNLNASNVAEYRDLPGCESLNLTIADHDYREKVVAPTCEEDGYTEYTCRWCGTTYKTDIIEKLGHDWDYENAVCAWEGNDYIATLTCKTDTSHKIQIKAKIEKTNEVPATCTRDGSADFTATFEQRELKSKNITTPVTRNTPKLAHTPGEAQDIITKNATCTEKGTYVTKVCCTVCGETITTSDEKEIAINPVNHTDRNSDNVCDGCGALIGVTLNVPVDTSVRYGTIVTVKANSYAMPNGYKIQAITSSKAYETNANDKEIIVPLGALEETQTIIFRVVDRNGNIAKDSTGSDMVKTVKITVVSNIFLRLIALIRKWLKRVPTVVIEPK